MHVQCVVNLRLYFETDLFTFSSNTSVFKDRTWVLNNVHSILCCYVVLICCSLMYTSECPATNGQIGLNDVHIVNLSLVSDVQVKKEVTTTPEPPQSLNLQRVSIETCPNKLSYIIKFLFACHWRASDISLCISIRKCNILSSLLIVLICILIYYKLNNIFLL